MMDLQQDDFGEFLLAGGSLTFEEGQKMGPQDKHKAALAGMKLGIQRADMQARTIFSTVEEILHDLAVDAALDAAIMKAANRIGLQEATA